MTSAEPALPLPTHQFQAIPRLAVRAVAPEPVRADAPIAAETTADTAAIDAEAGKEARPLVAIWTPPERVLFHRLVPFTDLLNPYRTHVDRLTRPQPCTRLAHRGPAGTAVARLDPPRSSLAWPPSYRGPPGNATMSIMPRSRPITNPTTMTSAISSSFLLREGTLFPCPPLSLLLLSYHSGPCIAGWSTDVYSTFIQRSSLDKRSPSVEWGMDCRCFGPGTENPACTIVQAGP